MRRGLLTKEIDWEYIAALLAQSSSSEQILFLNSFVRECKSWGTSIEVERQLAAVNAELSEDVINTLSMITYKE